MKHILKLFLTTILLNAMYAVEYDEASVDEESKKISVAPSLDSFKGLTLEQEAANAIHAGADRMHIDIPHPNPTLRLDFDLLRAVCASLPLDIHLLQNLSQIRIKPYKTATTISIPITHPSKKFRKKLLFIKHLPCKAGVVLNPDEPVDSIANSVLSIVDHVIVMAVKPGACGQSFIPSTLGKILQLKMKKTRLNLTFLIMVDGGVNPENAQSIIDSGADVLIACSSIFTKSDYEKAILALRGEHDEKL